MSKHTPGSWEVTGGDIVIGNNRTICIVNGQSGEPLAKKANARLIASAPELLEALKSISTAMAQPGDRISIITPEIYEKLRLSVQDIIQQAITKAEGGD